MFSFNFSVRVRYSETDKMGYVYYGNYASYFEVARVEALRSIGVSYKELEDSGVMLPVLAYSVKFFKPAFYDEMLTIRVAIKEIPTTRIVFEYATFNQNGLQLNQAETTLVFVDIKSGKPCRIPTEVKNAFNPFFMD